jgi:Ca-activated chloride channel family protein
MPSHISLKCADARLAVWRGLIVVLVISAGCNAQTPVFHSNVNLINITFTVRGGDRKLIGDLNRDEVEVFEDGIQQKVSFFSRTSDLPLNLGLIVDASESQAKFFKKHRRDIENFLKNVLGPQDQTFLLCFGNHLRLVSDFTKSVPQVIQNLDRFEHGERDFPEIGPVEDREEGTAFYDSIFYSVTEKQASSDHGRRALIVFSDGEDNSSAHHMLDAIEAAQTGDVLVYSVRYTEAKKGHLTGRNKYGIRVMERIARDTGAVDFDATKGDLDQTFRDIGAELHSLYEVAYHASYKPHDISFHKVMVQTTRDGAAVRAKSGYFAK